MFIYSINKFKKKLICNLQLEKLKAVLLYSIKSLTCFNGEEIELEEKQFPDDIYKLNKTLIRRNCHFITSRPRSLRYCFVADLFLDKEGIHEEKFDSLINSTEFQERSGSLADIENELNNLYSQVIWKLF